MFIDVNDAFCGPRGDVESTDEARMKNEKCRVQNWEQPEAE